MYAIDIDHEELTLTAEMLDESVFLEELDHWAVEDFTDILKQ